MKILTFPDPRLSFRCSPVSSIDPKIISEMFELMGLGLGLAAPQVGILERFFVMPGLVLINPEVISFSGAICFVECCLSLPGYGREVTRARHIVIEAFDFEGRLLVHRFQGLSARVAQHEIDHLFGRLINA